MGCFVKDSTRLTIGAVIAAAVFLCGLAVLSHTGFDVFVGVTCMYIGNEMANDIREARKRLI